MILFVKFFYMYTRSYLDCIIAYTKSNILSLYFFGIYFYDLIILIVKYIR